MCCSWREESLYVLATAWRPGPQVPGCTFMVMLLHVQHRCPSIGLQALHFSMAFGLTQAQCIYSTYLRD